ncbi:MAG: hypothetical protein WCQ72_06215 [Eubacteriales bacterium]
MKKFLSIAMTAMLVAAMAVPTFAFQTLPSVDVALTVPGCNATPVLDGTIGADEYSEIATTADMWSGAVADAANEGAADAIVSGAKLYMTWDADYVYFASTFEAPNGFYSPWEGDEGSMWQSAALQLSYSNAADKAEEGSQNRLEYGIGVTEAGTNLSTIWANYDGKDYAAEDIVNNFKIAVNGTTVTVEVRTPWSAFTDITPAAGAQVTTCIVYSIGVDTDYIHAQLAAGCTGEGGKNTSYEATLTLAEAPALPVVEEVTEEAPATDTAPTTTTAAQTSDATAAFAVLGVVALGAAAIVAKKVRG